MSTPCLAGYGKHRWRYRTDSMLGQVRECQKCGVLEQQVLDHNRRTGDRRTRWVRVASTWR